MIYPRSTIRHPRERITKIISGLLLIFTAYNSNVDAQTPFFQGKTIRFVVGYPAGSTHDLWARLVGPYLTKIIPGNPNTIVQNMPGAGSAVAANYVYGIAKPDGLSIAVVNAALYFDQLLARKGYNSIGPSSRRSAAPRGLILCSTCGPPLRIKPSKMCVTRPRRPSVEAQARATPDITCPSCLKKPSARSSPSSPVIKAALK